MHFSYGIEHEIAFLQENGEFADFSNTRFEKFQAVIDALPLYAHDYPQLRIGDAGIKKKRWYIEGFERFIDSEEVAKCAPKGIEIRTTVHNNIAGTITELAESYQLLRETSASHGLRPVLVSRNPWQRDFQPDPPLNKYEEKRREQSAEKQTANIPMLTYGPDLNFSIEGAKPLQIIDIGRKLTFYSPWIIPFSYSSPFLEGKVWHGLSARTYLRTGARPAAMVFLEDPSFLIESFPSLTKRARIPKENGRIEFKAFDSCADFSLYGALLALLKGIALDQSLPGRATTPHTGDHRFSAVQGFKHPEIHRKGTEVLEAAKIALAKDPEVDRLLPLERILHTRKSAAHEMKELFHREGSLKATLNHLVY